ncbi:MAG TPA: TonB-dependent receptor [Terriglobia bacterium]|nr:TonB-dependent receptor [Terriglobia bacterium]
MRRGIVYLMALSALGAAPLFAQSTLGTILGTVTDASGAVVAGCDVTVTNTDEGTSRSAKTDANGNFEMVNSKPGHYAVEATSAGFKTQRVQDLELLARQTLRVDVTLQLGQVTQQVQVEANAGVINTETETVSSTYNSLQITNLPTNYRASGNGNSPYYLLEILPGVQTDNSGNLSIQGGLQSQSQFSVDGISTTDTTGNQPLRNAFPSAESIAEIKVQGVGSPAEFGDPGDVTTISKSGTNQLHGDGFWYHQNAALDSIPFGAASKPSKIANDFGGSVGGPVVIPNLYNGHDKTFFFGTFEGFRLPRSGVVQDKVPTQAMRNGDESYLCSAYDANGLCTPAALAAGGVQLRDPFNGQPFKGNQIPQAMFNAASSKILSLYPLPNNGSGFTNNNYNVNVPANLDSNGFDVRGDQYFGKKLSVFGRFTYKNISTLSPTELLFPSSTDYERVRMLVTSATYTIKPTVLDEFRFGYTDDNFGNSNSFNGTAFSSGLGLNNIGQAFFNGVTEVDFTSLSSLNVDRLNGNNQARTIEFTDNLTWVKARHTFKFGVDTRVIRGASPLGFYGADNYGTFAFDPTFTGNDFADFLLGAPTGSELDKVSQDNDGRSRHWALFGQDSFRVSPRLTVEYGVRWEYHPAYHDAGGNIGNFDNSVPLSGRVVYPDGFANILAPGFLQSFDACPTAAVPLTANDPTSINGAPCTPVLSASQAGLPQGLRTTGERFLPRLGFAYKPFSNDSTVVHGGVGAYEAASLGSIFYALTGTIQSDTRTYINVSPTGQPIFTWPATSTGGTGIGAPQYGQDYFGTANDIRWKEPYSLQWNVSVEHEVGLHTGVRVSYIGMKTTQLVWAPDYNQSAPSTIPYPEQPLSSRPFPNWGIVNTRAIGATANYNALQIEANHKFSTGLTFDSTYTWSKNMADNQGPQANGGFCAENSCNRSADLYGRDGEYGNTFGPRTQNWTTTLIYQLPFGTGKRFANTSSKVLNGIIGGWQTSNIFLVQSGPWLTPLFNSGDPSGSGSWFDGRPQHPDRVGPAYSGTQNAGQWFASSGFVCPGASVISTTACSLGSGGTTPPPIGRFGTSGVGILEGPGTINWDFALAKSFNLSERAKLRVEVSFVNFLNHVNLGIPDMTITDPNSPSGGQCGFGCITSAQGLYQFAGARSGQIGARLEF